jgi:hypothetical protein
VAVSSSRTRMQDLVKQKHDKERCLSGYRIILRRLLAHQYAQTYLQRKSLRHMWLAVLRMVLQILNTAQHTR